MPVRRWVQEFAQYTAEFEAGGELGATTDAALRFRHGRCTQGGSRRQAKEPGGCAATLTCRKDGITASLPLERAASRSSKNRIRRLASAKPPRAIVSSEDEVDSHPLGDDPALQVKCLLPDTMSFDFAVNTMTYQPGAALSMVEMHVMEHGLIMLEGGGIYRLGDSWYPVTAGDFIWMGPWCPQWFGAIGKVPAKYLIYKDWNRHPMLGG